MSVSSDVAARAAELIRNATLCDLTLPWEENVCDEVKEGVWERYSANGFTFVSLTLADDVNWINDTIPYIVDVKRRIKQQPEKYIIVENVSDIERAHKERKLGLGFHLQGTNPFQGHLEMVEVYYLLGIRHALLAYNQRNLVGDGCHERTNGGLSRYGVALIAEMNRVGMLVDCTHAGIKTTLEAMEISKAPCIFSHSMARSLVNHERNITDEQIRALAATGGVIGLNGIGFFMSRDGKASTEALCDHIDYITALIGCEHIALGLDLIINPVGLKAYYSVKRELMYPNDYPPGPWDCWPPENITRLVEALLRRKYSERDIIGILGENFLQVARKVWR